MDNIQQNSPAPPPSNFIGDFTKNTVIIILLIVLVLSLLGVNIFLLFGNFLQYFTNILSPVVSKSLSDLGYASGTLLDNSSQLVANTAKTGIDILDGTVDSVGHLLIKASGHDSNQALDNHINQPPVIPPNAPEPNQTTSPIQGNPSSGKSQWCLVGEYNGSRGCVSVQDQDKCLSGQVFPSQQICLNPNLTQK
jgi:hypothetical protein